METNTHRPVPATDDIIEKLQKEVLEYGCQSSLYASFLIY